LKIPSLLFLHTSFLLFPLYFNPQYSLLHIGAV